MLRPGANTKEMVKASIKAIVEDLAPKDGILERFYNRPPVRHYDRFRDRSRDRFFMLDLVIDFPD